MIPTAIGAKELVPAIADLLSDQIANLTVDQWPADPGGDLQQQ
jgi:hypothetical protein